MVDTHTSISNRKVSAMPLPPVNANIPNPVPVQPPVGGAQGPANNAPVGNPPVAPEPLDNPPPEAPRMPAGELVAKLDSLLFRAAKTATASVDAAALEAAAGAAKLDDLTRQELSTLADRARASFAALAAFTGREIGNALALKDGAFEWKEGDPVATAIRKALDDQAELAEKLHELVNKPEIAGDAFDSLCELAFQCDRRGSEILTLAMELADAAEQAGRDKDAAADARLDRRLDALLPRQALSMHGTTAGLGLVHDSLRPLVDRLDALAARGPAEITAEELAAYTREIRETANALARAGREGIAVGADGSRVMPDRQLLDAAAAVLRGLEERLAGIRREVVLKALGKHVELADFSSIRRAPVVGDPAYLPGLSARAPMLAMAASLRHRLAGLAEQYARNPTRALKAEMEAVLEALQPLQPALIKKEISGLDQKDPYKNVTTEQWNVVYGQAKNTKVLAAMVAHLVAIGESLEGPLPPEKFLTAASARALFDGDLPLTTLVEARIRGMDDADVDPALDPSRVEKVEKLGSGQANTVYLAKLKDGSEYVFKPEVPGRKGIEPLNLSMDYRPETQVAHLNVATAKAAEHFGLGDLMVKTTVGVLDGQYGTFMEKAPGETCSDFLKRVEKQPGCLTPKEIRHLPDEQYGKVLGRIVRQTNRLEWFDMLTGQGDRHSRNYMIQVKSDLTVTVKCIDNDACYPAYRTGLRKVVLDPARARYFKSLYDGIVNEYPPELRDEIRRKLESDPGIKALPGNRLEVDPSKFAAGELHWAFRRVTGSDCDVLPSYIDEDLYNHLVAMAPGSEAREAYRQDLLKRLPADAVESAMLRLDEAIALAERFKNEGKVISAEDFEKREVQKSILNDELFGPTSPIKPASNGFDLKRSESKQAKNICQESRLQFHGLFTGDLAYSVCRKDWFQ